LWLCMYPWLSHCAKHPWDGFQHSSTCCQVRVGSCDHFSSRQAINIAASQDPDADRAYPLLKAPKWGDWLPRPVPGRWGRWNGQIGGEILPAHVYRNKEKRICGLLLGLVLFRLVVPPLQLRVVMPFRYGVCGSSVICCWRKPIVSRIVDRNWWPTVPGVLDLDIFLKLKYFL
jgi:hypothetical protein